jgi:hypothetical protein
MAAPEDDGTVWVAEIRAAAGNGQLPALAERLARERRWLALTTLFEQTGLTISLTLFTETVRAASMALRNAPERRRDRASTSEDIRTVRLLAGEGLLRRVARPALTEPDRLALHAAGTILADGGDLHRAATTFEHAGDWATAAEVWGRLGDLDAMESCLSRDEDRLRSNRAASGAVRDIDGLLAAGERVAALRLAESIPEGVVESGPARQIVVSLNARLVRTRGVTLRRGEGQARPAWRFAATPALLGRDAFAEIPLRDPGVSRRHALISVVGDEPSITDVGSRAGTFVAGARLSTALPVRGSTEITLGTSCHLELQVQAPGRVRVRGLSGLDRSVVAIVGAGPLPLHELMPEAAGAWIEFDRSGARFCRPPELSVRIAGQFVSTRVDLLHGDILEIGAEGARLEVE